MLDLEQLRDPEIAALADARLPEAVAGAADAELERLRIRLALREELADLHQQMETAVTDGDADLFVGFTRRSKEPARLYRNDGFGRPFVNVVATSSARRE